MSWAARVFQGQSLAARAVRSAGLTVFSIGWSQVLRLLSNLILTRLLFPEAFGLMALVTVFLMGLNMFSDVGVAPAIMQSKRGDEQDFLDTAWTIQVIRGGLIWLGACVISWPVSVIYDVPELLFMLPVAALSLIIKGFLTTRYFQASRHLQLGRITLIDMVTQLVGLLSAIGLAYVMQSVWALILSGVIAALAELVIYERFLPGKRNRFRWEPAAGRELISFGKWIFLSTVAGFLVSQADKLMIGEFLPLDQFGVYNIGYFLASFPMLLGTVLVGRLFIPIYREWPPQENRENFLKLRKARFLVTGILLTLNAILGVLGVWLVDLLYDARYSGAGVITVLVALSQIPAVLFLTYDQAALAAGDSRRFFVLAASKAALIVVCLYTGLSLAGLLGGIIGAGVAVLLVYPVVVWLSRSAGAWDPLHDLCFAVVGLLIAAVCLALHSNDISRLAGL